MDVHTLTAFFMWCTIINVVIYAWAAIWVILAPDFVYRMQSKLLNISRDRYDVAYYSFLAAYKLFIIVFNFTPYLALSIIG